MQAQFDKSAVQHLRNQCVYTVDEQAVSDNSGNFLGPRTFEASQKKTLSEFNFLFG